MSLIQYHILNLPFREDRKYAQLGAFALMGYNREDIRFHDAPSGYEYENAEAVCQAATEDGFTGFIPCPSGGKETKNAFAYMWGTLQIMREILNGEPPFGYYNQDDLILKVGPKRIHQDIEELENLKIAQLYWWKELENPRRKVPNKLYYEGCHTLGDSGLILSKAGAKLFIDTFQEKYIWMEKLINKIAKVNKDGIYCVVDKDSRVWGLGENWLKWKQDGIGSENQGESPILVDNKYDG